MPPTAETCDRVRKVATVSYVKIIFFKQTERLGHATGFKYCTEPYIVTSGHFLLQYGAADRIEAEYSDGTREAVVLVAQSLYPDSVVYRGSKVPLNFLHAHPFFEREDGFVFGFASAASPTLNLSTNVQSSKFLTSILFAPTDEGGIGGPCMDKFGKFFGLVKGGDNGSMRSCVCEITSRLHIFLATNRLPLLCG